MEANCPFKVASHSNSKGFAPCDDFANDCAEVKSIISTDIGTDRCLFVIICCHCISVPTMMPNLEKGYERCFCIRMKSTLTKRGVHVRSSGYRVRKESSFTHLPSVCFLVHHANHHNFWARFPHSLFCYTKWCDVGFIFCLLCSFCFQRQSFSILFYFIFEYIMSLYGCVQNLRNK